MVLFPADKEIKDLDDSLATWWEHGYLSYGYENIDNHKDVFETLKINNCLIKNRIGMAPISNIGMADSFGGPSDTMINFYEERAKGGVGLIISGRIPTNYRYEKNLLSEKGDYLYPNLNNDERVISSWRKLTDCVHSYGSKFFTEISLGDGKYVRTSKNKHLFSTKGSTFQTTTTKHSHNVVPYLDYQLDLIIKDAVEAIKVAKKCNVDGIVLEGDAGRLLDQLTSSSFGTRTILSKYHKNNKFGTTLVKQIRKKIGNNYPIIYRFNLSTCLNEVYSSFNKHVPYLLEMKKQRTIKKSLNFIQELIESGVDGFEFTLGLPDNSWLNDSNSLLPPAPFIKINSIVRDFIEENKIKTLNGDSVKIFAGNKLGFPKLISNYLESKVCDLILLGKPLLADPYFVDKVSKDRCSSIIPCVYCKKGCLCEVDKFGPVTCNVNTGLIEHNSTIDKKVCVINGGVEGMYTALALLEKGCTVYYYNKEEELGGISNKLIKNRISKDLSYFVYYLIGRIDAQKGNSKFSLKLGLVPTLEDIKKENFDYIFVGTDFKYVGTDDYKGKDLNHVFDVLDVYKNPNIVKDYENILIVGDSPLACEIAYILSYELNKKVKLITQKEYLMDDCNQGYRSHIIHYLEKAGTEIYNCTTLKEIENDRAIVSQNIHRSVPNPYITYIPLPNSDFILDKNSKVKKQDFTKHIPCDAVILAPSKAPDHSLYESFKENFNNKNIFIIGLEETQDKEWSLKNTKKLCDVVK